MVSLKYTWGVGFVADGCNVRSFIFLNTFKATLKLEG